MDFLRALWIHMTQLLTFRHNGEDLPERWSPVVGFILILTVMSSQLYFMVLTYTAPAPMVTAQGQPNEVQRQTVPIVIPDSSVNESAESKQDQEAVSVSRTERSVGLVIGQLISFLIVGMVGGVSLLISFALVQIPLDLLRTVFLIIDVPFIGLLFIWEWIAIGVITWRFIRKKHGLFKK